MRKAKGYQELVDFIADRYNDKVAMLIFEKIELIENDPFEIFQSLNVIGVLLS